MSSWGTGIKQSDEFCDIYDDFFERYVDDAEPLKLADDIWAEYLSEFDDDDADPILYTVRFALAQCVWECGAKDQKLWSEIDDIILHERSAGSFRASALFSQKAILR